MYKRYCGFLFLFEVIYVYCFIIKCSYFFFILFILKSYMIKYMVKYIEFFNGVYLDRSLLKLGDLFFYI